MKKHLSFIAVLALLLVASGNSFASAWWMLCDRCQTHEDFEKQALNAPWEHTPVYVTNRDTNETRKFDRTFAINDLADGLEVSIIVRSASFRDGVKPVFERVVDNANVTFVELRRDDLVDFVPHLDNQNSVVGDISSGYIDPRLTMAMRQAIDQRDLMPSHTILNAEAGTDIEGAAQYSGTGYTIRIRSLGIQVNYPDGSTISLMKRGNDGKFMNWSVVDAADNSIPLKGNIDGNVPLDVNAFLREDFFFGGPGSQDQGLALANRLRTETGTECTAVQLAEQITKVTCNS